MRIESAHPHQKVIEQILTLSFRSLAAEESPRRDKDRRRVAGRPAAMILPHSFSGDER